MEVHPQVSLRATDTVIRKKRFERNLNNFGHSVEIYLGDNSFYRFKEFRDDHKARGQTIEFCGIGAHHQNGVAERAIRTVSEHWPGNVDLSLWSMTVKLAVHIYNMLPNMNTGLAPLGIVTGSRLDGSELRNSRVCGCPAYVLDSKVQDGNKLPRWIPKSIKGQFLGRSRTHISSIGLIRNLETIVDNFI